MQKATGKEILWSLYFVTAMAIVMPFMILTWISKTTKIPFDILGVIATTVLGFWAIANSDAPFFGFLFLFSIPAEIWLVKDRIEEEEIEERKRKRNNRYYQEEQTQQRKKREYEQKQKKQEKQRDERNRIAIEQKKKQVELNAMNYSMNYERNKYRNPADVSSQNLGYDIKSSDSNETRLIEVKGKADSGNIEITTNEWDKAKEHENNYFLYIIYNANSDA